MGFPKKEQTIM